MSTRIAMVVTWMVGAAVSAAGAADASAATGADFAHEVAPLLERKCGRCHTTPRHKGGLSMDTRQALLSGGETGPAAVPGDSGKSLMMRLIVSKDADERMPSKGKPLTPAEVEVLRRWIDAGMAWDSGVVLGTHRAVAAMEPRRPMLPAPGGSGSTHAVDRIIEAQVGGELARAEVVSDAVFIRRASLDIVGLIPTPTEVETFERDGGANKRARLVATLLGDRRNYADHWLTFWNDALRNAYRGTGFIDGGRRQITSWLYRSLHENKAYDVFVRELVTGAEGAEGFVKGIVWRGVVNASQRPEMQAAQNVAQVFMGTNLKCASCHDSFVDNWKLADAYGLAAVFAEGPLELHRCDKPLGETAKAAFIYPELGTIDAAAGKTQRVKQLAELLTARGNGRLARTMVNRLWAALMGRGIVEPVDDMDQRPWNADLLDYLAADFQEHGYDVKRTIELICTSRAYALASVGMSGMSAAGLRFGGPVVKRMTAEQFCDAVSRVTRVWEAPATGSLTIDGRAQGGQLAAVAPVLGVALKATAREDKKRKQVVVSYRVDAGAFPAVRAALRENDALMAALGRPHREQVVTRRESVATMLQALEMTNGRALDEKLRSGAAKWSGRGGDVVEQLYRAALGRAPTPAERAAARELVGDEPGADGVADLLWALVMLPEFQLY